MSEKCVFSLHSEFYALNVLHAHSGEKQSATLASPPAVLRAEVQVPPAAEKAAGAGRHPFIEMRNSVLSFVLSSRFFTSDIASMGVMEEM